MVTMRFSKCIILICKKFSFYIVKIVIILLGWGDNRRACWSQESAYVKRARRSIIIVISLSLFFKKYNIIVIQLTN